MVTKAETAGENPKYGEWPLDDLDSSRIKDPQIDEEIKRRVKLAKAKLDEMARKVFEIESPDQTSLERRRTGYVYQLKISYLWKDKLIEIFKGAGYEVGNVISIGAGQEVLPVMISFEQIDTLAGFVPAEVKTVEDEEPGFGRVSMLELSEEKNKIAFEESVRGVVVIKFLNELLVGAEKGEFKDVKFTPDSAKMDNGKGVMVVTATMTNYMDRWESLAILLRGEGLIAEKIKEEIIGITPYVDFQVVVPFEKVDGILREKRILDPMSGVKGDTRGSVEKVLGG